MLTTRKTVVRLAALVAVGALVLAACGDDDNSSSKDKAASAKGVKCPNIAFAFFGALTGPNANLGINERNGMKVALKDWNDANPNCKVDLKEFDSQGSADQAPALAQQAIQDQKIVAMVGPAFSGESRTANPILDQGGLPLITASATGVDLSTKGWKVFHRGVGNDNAQGPAIASYLTKELNAKRVAVLDDKSEYGKGIADIVRSKLGAADVVNDSFDDKATEFSSTVNKLKAANIDAVVFGGYYAQAGPLAKQLKDGGVKATFVGPDGVNDMGFVKGAGDAAEGAVLTAPAAPLETITGSQQFKDAYRAINGTDTGLYSAEAYDATNVFLECVKQGKVTRSDINACLSTISFQGLTKNYKWDANGELAGQVTVYAYRVDNGEIKGVAPISA